MSFLRFLRSVIVTVCFYLFIGFFLITFLPNFFNTVSSFALSSVVLILWFCCGVAFNFEIGESLADDYAKTPSAFDYCIYGILAIVSGPFGFLSSDLIQKKLEAGRMNDLPTKPGVYLVEGIPWSDSLEEIEVYEHPIKGLCCYSEDFGSAGSEVDDETDCHVSVQLTGLRFIQFVHD